MPKKLQKSLSDYLSKIKKQTPQLQFSHSSLIASTTSKIFSGCKHPKSLSFAADRKGNHDHNQDHHDDGLAKDETAATLEDIDKFLIENFRSLYGQDFDRKNDHVLKLEGEKKEKTREYHRGPTPSPDGTSLGRGAPLDSPRFFTPPPDLCGSHRFFVSPSSSGSLAEEGHMSGPGTGMFASEDTGSTSASASASASTGERPAIPGGVDDCIAVLTVSPTPYDDFRKSMQEIVEARVNHNQKVDWDFMEELLFCYLRLNEKKQYRFILSAFVDLVVILRQNPSNGRGPDGSRSSDGENYSPTTWKGKGTRNW